jgi:hypothetical protein
VAIKILPEGIAAEPRGQTPGRPRPPEHRRGLRAPRGRRATLHRDGVRPR